MYREQRPIAAGAMTASTPESWAKNFERSKPLNGWRRIRMNAMFEARLARRYVQRGSTVLDAGCGFGEWVTFLSGLGYRTIGVDYAPELIRRLRAAYPDCEWVQGDIRSLPQDDASVDAIISWGVVEHDESGSGAALREFHRVLRPNGIAIITVPVDSPAARRVAKFVDELPMTERAFFQYYLTPDELRAEMVGAGFDVVGIGTLPVAHIAMLAPSLMRRYRQLGVRLANLVVQLLLSWMERYRVMLYVVARKSSSSRIQS